MIRSAITVAAMVAATVGGPAATGQASPPADDEIYVVVLEDAAAARSVGATAARHGVSVRRTFTSAVRGFSATMNATQARDVAQDPQVAYVQRNVVHGLVATQPNPPSWGLDRIDQRALPLNSSYTYPNTAASVHAYLLDTGIRFTHVDFGGRATSGFDAVDGGTADDCHGHGTHTAGTLGGTTYGVAKEVRLVAVRVLDCAGSGTTESVLAGVDWVTANAIKPAVANMSLGGAADPVLDAAVRRSIAAGVTFAMAAGNDNVDACTRSPGRVGEGLTVSATDRVDARLSWANHGTCVDLLAPGAAITSASGSSDTGSRTISGTSMSAPHVAGAAALYLQANPLATPAQVNAAIVAAATTGVVSNLPAGTPNRLLFVGTPTTPPPTMPPTTPPPTSPAPTPTLTSPAPPASGCAATYGVAVQWPGGFMGDVRVRNTGAVPTDGWTVRWTFADGQAISLLWNGTLSTSGASVTVRNAIFNGVIPVNGSTSFGFLASWNGAVNSVPTDITCTSP